MAAPALDFWFDFASTYSYLAAVRIGSLAVKASVDVRFRPFLLGPIFKAQGWDTSPFSIYQAKGRYMWRDMERQAADLGRPFRRPDVFPQNSLLAARVATQAGATTSASLSSSKNSNAEAGSTTMQRWLRSCRSLASTPARLSPQPNPTPTSFGCAPRPRRHRSSASSARRRSSPRKANYSGATIGWSRRWPGSGVSRRRLKDRAASAGRPSPCSPWLAAR
jgi:hypothetical protein